MSCLVTRLCHCVTTASLSNSSLLGMYMILLPKFVVFQEKCLAIRYLGRYKVRVHGEDAIFFPHKLRSEPKS